jgi:hypothetical protein
MNTPKFFKRNTPATSSEKSADNLSVRSVFFPILSFLLIALALGYVGFKSIGTYQYVTSHWQEFVFAYTKPELVKTIRVQYEHKQAALDQEFLTGKPSDQELKKQVQATVKEELEAQTTQQPKQTYSAFK